MSKKTIYLEDAIDAVGSMLRRKFGIGGDLAEITLAGLPSAQPEITLESAIDYLQSIGWMQEHDRILSESAQPERKTGYIEIRVISPFDGEDCFCSECGANGLLPSDKFCRECGVEFIGVRGERDE